MGRGRGLTTLSLFLRVFIRVAEFALVGLGGDIVTLLTTFFLRLFIRVTGFALVGSGGNLTALVTLTLRLLTRVADFALVGPWGILITLPFELFRVVDLALALCGRAIEAVGLRRNCVKDVTITSGIMY